MSGEESQLSAASDGLGQQDLSKQDKPRPGPGFLVLTRCAACYDQQGHSMPRRQDDSESSSEGSGPEFDWDSESSSSSSCSSSRSVSAATTLGTGLDLDSPGSGLKAPTTVAPAEPGEGEQGPKEQSQPEWRIERQKEGREGVECLENREDEIKTKTRRSFSPFIRPPSVVSTLHLQVVPGEQGIICAAPGPVCQATSERKREEEAGERMEEGQDGNNGDSCSRDT